MVLQVKVSCHSRTPTLSQQSNNVPNPPRNPLRHSLASLARETEGVRDPVSIDLHDGFISVDDARELRTTAFDQGVAGAGCYPV